MVQDVQRISGTTGESNIDQQSVALRISGVSLGDLEMASRIAARLTISESVLVGAIERVCHVVGFEPHFFPVADLKFQRVNIGRVQARVIDLGENSALQGEPYVRSGGG